MELLYIWLDKHLPFNGLGFNFSHKFKVTYIQKNKSLEIIPTESQLPEDFFSPNILNLNCIVGENGCGKSRFLEFLSSFLLNYYTDSIIVFKGVDDKIIIYYNSEITNISIKTELNYEEHSYSQDRDQLKINEVLKSILPIYYKSHLDIRSNTFANSEYEISTTTLFFNEADKLNSSILNKSLPDRRNIIRSVYEDFQFEEFKKQLNLKKYLSKNDLLISTSTPIHQVISRLDQVGLFFKNNFRNIYKSSLYTLIIRHKHWKLLIENATSEPNAVGWINIKSPVLFKIMVLISIADKFDSIDEDIKPFVSKDDTFEDIYSNLLNKFKKSYNEYSAIYEVIDSISENEIVIQYSYPVYDPFHLQLKINIEKFNLLLKAYENTKLKQQEIFGFYWTLSTGEQLLIGLFSRLLAIKEEKISNNNEDKVVWLLLDEPDLGLHPQWAKEFILSILLIIPVIFKDNKVQIFITTHSPIVLSDIPKCNITFLKKKDSKSSEISTIEHQQTFAANIYDLYEDSFFIKNGFIGSFAQSQIDSINNYIKYGDSSGSKLKDIVKKMQLIGEPLIKNRLQDLLEQKLEKSHDIKILKVVISRKIKND